MSDYWAEEFGVVADNATDDASALQAALDHIATVGGRLHLPPGTMALMQDIEVSAAAKPFEVVGVRGASKLRRAADTTYPLNIVSCNDVRLAGFSIDAGYAQFPTNASHGLNVKDSSHVLIERVSVANWKGTAIISYESAATIGTVPKYFDVVVDRCEVDGGGVANNGILLSNLGRSGIRNSIAANIGKGGSPCYALQLKNGCQDSFIESSYASNARIGVACGNNDPSAIPAVRNRLSNLTVVDCNTGVGLGSARDLTGCNFMIDMSRNIGNAIDFNGNTERCSITDAFVKNLHETRHAVLFREGDKDNVAEVTVVERPVSGTAALAVFNPGSERNVARVGHLCGSASQPTWAVMDNGSNNAFSYA